MNAINASAEYKLAPYVKIGFKNKVLKVGFGSIQKEILSSHLQKALIELFEILLEPKTLEEIKSLCFSNFRLNADESEELFSLVKDGNFLIKNEIYNRSDRYSRHKLFYNLSGIDPEKTQKNIEEKKVIIIGCGGIGNLISVTLATAGINEITLVDNDSIELSNLTRQLMFSEADEGKSKTYVLERELKKRASHLRINTLKSMLNCEKDFDILPLADLIVLSGDSSNICSLTNKYAYKKNIPFIHVGYVQDIAIWGPLIIPGQTGCYECFIKSNIANQEYEDSLYQQKINKINQHYQAPSIGPVNMLAAANASLEILKFLGGFDILYSLGQRIGIWTHLNQIQYQTYTKDTNCKICRNF